MASWTPQKRDVLDGLADEFLHNYGKGRTLLAVDGVDGAVQFADALAERMGRGGHAVFRASMGRFQKPRAQRLAPGADSVETYYRDTFDYELFRRVLVQPFKLGGSTGFVTAAFDAERDAQIEMDWKTGPQDATLIVDGAFLNRAELRGLWNFSIWLEVADATEQAPYIAEAKPREHATAIMDVSDPEHPRRLFADSC